MLLNTSTTHPVGVAGVVLFLIATCVLPIHARAVERPAALQGLADPVQKRLDVTREFVAAIALEDSAGKFLTNATAVVVHPRVLLTVAHAAPGFAARTYLSGHDVGDASVSFEANFKEDGGRIGIRPNQWISFPGFGEGGEAARQAVDVAIIILDEAVNASTPVRLPEPDIVNSIEHTSTLTVSGFGMHQPADPSPSFPPLQTDGNRRTYEASLKAPPNRSWFTITGRARAGDSGSPVVVALGGEQILLGLVSQSAPEGGALVVRMDHPEVLKWIHGVVGRKLGVQLRPGPGPKDSN